MGEQVRRRQQSARVHSVAAADLGASHPLRRHPNLRKCLAAVTICWFVRVFLQAGLSVLLLLAIPSLSGSLNMPGISSLGGIGIVLGLVCIIWDDHLQKKKRQQAQDGE